MSQLARCRMIAKSLRRLHPDIQVNVNARLGLVEMETAGPGGIALWHMALEDWEQYIAAKERAA